MKKTSVVNAISFSVSFSCYSRAYLRKRSKARMLQDGVNSVKYNITHLEFLTLYTNISITFENNEWREDAIAPRCWMQSAQVFGYMACHWLRQPPPPSQLRIHLFLSGPDCCPLIPFSWKHSLVGSMLNILSNTPQGHYSKRQALCCSRCVDINLFLL